ncbi:MAG: tetratricopeptide repeat protein [Elainellaceae cyanobacterium]
MPEILPPKEHLLTEIGVSSDTLKRIKPHWHRSSYQAALNWLTKYKPNPTAANLDHIKSLLEAFHHLCEIDHWQAASKIANLTLNTPDNNKLRRQLSTWGYFPEQLSLYEPLLGKLSTEWDHICLNGLGNAHYALGNYPKAITLYKQCLHSAQAVNESPWAVAVLNGLGNAYLALGRYAKARACYSHYLSSAQAAGDHQTQSAALCNLGNICDAVGDHPQAITYHTESLTLAQKIGDRYRQGSALNGLANAYSATGAQAKALEHYRQHLELSQKTGNRHGEASAQDGLGNNHYAQGDHGQATGAYEQSLAIAWLLSTVPRDRPGHERVALFR